MRKRLTCISGFAALALTGAYLMSPLLAAHNLRQAIKSGDTKTVARMIEWTSLRASIRTTVAKNANLLPVATEVARQSRPTMWQRIRSVFGHSMLDRFVENYITPEGLPKLYRAKTRWHGRGGGEKPPSAVQASVIQASIVPDGLAQAWRRIKRAEFKNLFQFDLEIEDRHVATRLITSTFKLSNISLRGFEWKLVSLSIRNLNPARLHLSRLNGF